MHLIGNKEIERIFEQIKSDLNKNKGGTLAIEGETGFGKSHTINFLYEQVKNSEKIAAVLVDNQSPINDINIGNIQPLQPFAKAIRDIIESNKSAKKKFMLNLGMTTLASLPLIGEIFYAVKEFRRDWREYKKDKETETKDDINQLVSDFHDTILTFSEKQPVLIFLDNMQYADKLSVQLLNELIASSNNYPVAVIFTYRKEEAKNGLNELIKHYLQNNDVFHHYTLKPLDIDEIREFCKVYISNFKPNSLFEEWLLEKTRGVPGLLSGYIEHFKHHPPFDANGKLKYDLDNTDIFPENINTALENILEELNDDEIDLLGICANENAEFSAYLIAHLLNTDIVNTIKKLRVIQNKVNVIKSLGPKNKYGVKTTVYKFTQEYYFKYFENLLEYEEKISIHGQIAAFLKQKLESTQNENLRNELAPYVAAHSIVSEDEETAKEMLVLTAQAANEIEGHEIVEQAFAAYQNISGGSSESDDAGDRNIFNALLNQKGNGPYAAVIDGNISEQYSTADESYPIDFRFIRRSIVDEFHKGNYQKAVQLVDTYLSTHKKTLKPSEISQLLSIAARCYVELENLETAKEYLERAMSELENYKEPIPEAFALNVSSIINIEEGKDEEAYAELKKAAKKSMYLPPEIKLITIANIALFLKKHDPKQAEKYFQILRKMTHQLHYEGLAEDIFD